MIKKIVLIFVYILILSGCTAEYNINIDKDLIIDETIVLGDSTYNIKKQNLNVDSFIDSILYEFDTDPNYSMYVYEKDIKESFVNVKAKTIYLDFLGYNRNNNVKENLFSKLNIYEDNGTYTFEYKIKPKDQIKIFNESESLYDSLIDEVTVNITLPFQVEKHNADSYIAHTGTYTWNYSKNSKLKDINIKFNTNKMSLGSDAPGIYFMVVLVAMFCLVFGYTVYKYKSNNKV